MNFDDFDDLFNQLFAGAYNRFNAPVKDMQPFKAFAVEDKGYVVVCKTLGISKENISVNIIKEKGTNFRLLKVTGQTKIEKIDFSNKVDLGIRLKFEEDIENIQYEVKDGLTIIFIKTKQDDPKPELTASYIEDSSGLDW